VVEIESRTGPDSEGPGERGSVGGAWARAGEGRGEGQRQGSRERGAGTGEEY
jgi:hypothetical protein